MDNHNGDSGVNTLLIVVILLIIVGTAVWFYSRGGITPTQQGTPKINVDLNMPTVPSSPSGTGL